MDLIMRTFHKRKVRQVLISMFVGAAIVFGLYAVNQIFAPDAKADNNSFIYALEHSGNADFYGQKGVFLSIGYLVCTDWGSGYSYDEIANNIYWNPSYDFDRGSANVLVGAAIANLC
jgi:hypothetical protein